MPNPVCQTQEGLRLAQSNSKNTQPVPWKKWGPYLSERQWGTVREDYSENGDAWSYFTHDQARSRAYKWGEDGLAGYTDEKSRLCWALALWNEQDAILKERLFGLSNAEANHGEDVKEVYFYLDSTPTHSYMKYLYKYPQQAFPYEDLVTTNRRRTRQDFEYELLDTGIFDDNRYFDVFVEFFKAGPEDTLIVIQAANRGPQAAALRILPQLWFRNTWWMEPGRQRPLLRALDGSTIEADHPDLGKYYLYCENPTDLLFTENETNTQRVFGQSTSFRFLKDGINDYVVGGNQNGVNPGKMGTKSAALYRFEIQPGETATVRLRLTNQPPAADYAPFADSFTNTQIQRKAEADEFYASLTPPALDADQANILRQALAGLLWSKQHYFFDLDLWLSEHHANPLTGGKRPSRNRDWYHMVNDDIISMPDKWEYPWYAAWDLAFHTLSLKIVDAEFAEEQLYLMLKAMYLHPSGQVPAYEWNFSDTNPPVQAWAAVFNLIPITATTELSQDEVAFLERMFKKLLLNFTWWVNRKDPTGKHIFSGGFLGMDNIGLFDRSQSLPTGGYLDQADGTAWMAFYCQNMIQIAATLARYDLSYVEFVSNFAEQFFWIAGSMDRVGNNRDELWDDEDGFYYDVLVLPDGTAQRIKVRSMVGLLPLCATTVLPPPKTERYDQVTAHVQRFISKHPGLAANIHPPLKPGHSGRLLLATVNEEKLRRILARMLDEERFLSPYGIRSLSRWHLDHPYEFDVHGETHRVGYLPAESDNGMFGGNSNWRGPIWIPMNLLLVRALGQFYQYYGDDFKIECPTGSGQMLTLYEVMMELIRRLTRIFTRDEAGQRPLYGGSQKFQDDPYWKDYILFYEYFHGDNGAGLGASHQTGWTGNVARLLQILGTLTPEKMLAGGRNILAED